MQNFLPERLQRIDPRGFCNNSFFSDPKTSFLGDDDIRCMIIVETEPVSICEWKNLLYVKIIILTPKGRLLAKEKQLEIMHRFGIDSCDSARFIKACAVAITLWEMDQMNYRDASIRGI